MLRSISKQSGESVDSVLEKKRKATVGWKDLQKRKLCLQCFDAVGWAAGRASGL